MYYNGILHDGRKPSSEKVGFNKPNTDIVANVPRYLTKSSYNVLKDQSLRITKLLRKCFTFAALCGYDLIGPFLNHDHSTGRSYYCHRPSYLIGITNGEKL